MRFLRVLSLFAIITLLLVGTSFVDSIAFDPNAVKFAIKDSAGLKQFSVFADEGRMVIGSEALLHSNHQVEIIAPAGVQPFTIVGGTGNFQFWKDAAASRAINFGFSRPGSGIVTDDMVFSLYRSEIGWFERMRLTNDAGNLGIGTSVPTQKLEVNGGVRLNTASSKPACDSTTRGTFWFTQGGTGVADSVQVCAKDAAGSYAWRVLY